MNDWIVWQIADSAFPIGGFAHSGGLEAAWRAGYVPDQHALGHFVHSNLHQCAAGIVPLSLMAFRDEANVGRADELCDLFLNHPVPNRASRSLGRSLVAMMRQICPEDGSGGFDGPGGKDIRPVHFAVAMGAVCRILSIPETQVSRLMIFMSMRSVISAGIRLGIIGPLAGQSLQLRLSPVAETLASRALRISPEEIAQTSPMADLLQGCQDRLYSRLFQS
jgi:urease accessory protein